MNLNYQYIENEYASTAKQIYELETIVKKGGPDKSEYNKLREIAISLKDMSLEEELELYEIFKPILTIDSIIGHTFLKPYGYAGDYELIDKIYQKRVSADPFLAKWDHYYHDANSATAVRNRKSYFIKQINRCINTRKTSRILNLGSGPCRDVYEYYSSNEGEKIFIDCLDMDKNALDHGAKVCADFIDNITFINKNAFRYKADNKYNLIWSAGLFDYFSDKLFIRLTNRMYQMLHKGGELIIGNFSDKNPGREEMEVFGKWYLHHRSEKTLINLAIKAGIERHNITISSEYTGVNLFLHIKK